MPKSNSNTSNTVLLVLKYTVLIIFSLVAFYPLFWMFMTSLKSSSEVYANSFGLPHDWIWTNYREVWTTSGFPQAFLNSIIVSAASVATIVLVSSMAAYVLTRVWPNKYMITFVSLGIMIPGQALLLPVYLIVAKGFGLGNTLLSLYLIYTATGISFSTFFLLGFLKSIPVELEDAAFMDGYSRARTFFAIILPLARPGLATVAVFQLIWKWNEFLLALVFISSKSKYTLTLAISSLQDIFVTDFGLITSGLVMATIPAIIFFIVFQEQVVKGMTAGAVKG